VAELGCNHGGQPELARRMVDAAKQCGVDAVKFQTFQARELISRYAPKADYQKLTTGPEGSQLEMTERLALRPDDYLALRQYAQEQGLDAFSTPFDEGSIRFLQAHGQTVWKIPSGELTNLPYLEQVAAIRCPGKRVLLSTGMATLDEIHRAVDILVRDGSPQGLMLLHCNTEYPTPDCDVNLSAIPSLRAEFPGIPLGFSDHSVGWVAATAAALMGVELIEKHFTLDKTLPGPDQRASADPTELAQLCQAVRRLPALMGSGGKRVTPSESRNLTAARKSIVARRPIRKGETLTAGNITCKRPGNGVSPMRWYEVIGTPAIRDFQEDELIEI
jgi:N-acetylneuraminate synthase